MLPRTAVFRQAVLIEEITPGGTERGDRLREPGRSKDRKEQRD